MLTDRSAKLLNFDDYGLAVGRPGDIVIINAHSPEQAVAEISQPIAAFKRGRQTVAWELPQLLRPQ
jgi:cytosine deaminase